MALTTTPLFGFPRHTDDFTLTGSHWDSDYPVTNLQDLEFAKVARSTSLGVGSPDDPVIVQGTSSTTISVQAFGIAAHTLSLTATYRLQLYSDTGLTTQIYDSGLQDVWPVSYTAAELEGQIPLNPILLSQAYSIRGFKLSLYDPDNDLAYFDIGYLEIAEAWQPSVGIEMGAQFGYINYTETDTLPGGLERHTVYAPSFTFSGQIPYLDETEADENAMELFRQLGVHTPFMFVLHPTRSETWLRKAKMVTLVDPGLLSYATYSLETVPISVKEYKG
jgi:hypothetical protein